jgi:hypothetical protein
VTDLAADRLAEGLRTLLRKIFGGTERRMRDVCQPRGVAERSADDRADGVTGDLADFRRGTADRTADVAADRLAKFVDRGADRAAGAIADTSRAALGYVADGGENLANIAADFMTDGAECIAGGSHSTGSSAGRSANNIAGQVLGNTAALVAGRAVGVSERRE